MALLDIHELQTWFDTRAGVVKAVDGVSLSVDRGETVAGRDDCGAYADALAQTADRIGQGEAAHNIG